MIIYMQQTVEMLPQAVAEELITNNEVCKTEKGLIYLKIKEL